MSRQAFEKWALAEGFNIDRDPDVPKYADYHRTTTRWAWLAWQAAAAEAAAFVDSKADEQEQTNKAYPEHAKCYPSWEARVTQLRWLAEHMRRAFFAECEAEARDVMRGKP